MTVIGTAEIQVEPILTVGTVVRLRQTITRSRQGNSYVYGQGTHAEVVGLYTEEEEGQQGSRGRAVYKVHFEGGDTIDVYSDEIERVRTQSDVLEDILVALKEIAEALKPKEVKVTVKPGDIKVDGSIDERKLAELSVRELDWQFGYAIPKQVATKTKEARNLNRGEVVTLNDRSWHVVGRVMPLGHGDVWVYDSGGQIIARVKGDREVKIKVTP